MQLFQVMLSVANCGVETDDTAEEGWYCSKTLYCVYVGVDLITKVDWQRKRYLKRPEDGAVEEKQTPCCYKI